MQSLSWNKP
jgi:hypothetical protein